MAWHYYNENGEKSEPITNEELEQLVCRGIIRGATIIEDESGNRNRAKEIPGLYSFTFPCPHCKRTLQAKKDRWVKQWIVPLAEQTLQCLMLTHHRNQNHRLRIQWYNLSLLPKSNEPSTCFFAAYESGEITMSRETGTLLHAVAGTGDDFCVVIKFLVSQGADVNTKGDGGLTPLHVAVANSNVEIVKFLVFAGADVNAKTIIDAGITPLQMAAKVGNVEVAEILVSSGADVNATTKDGGTALHMAAYDGNVEVVKYLVSKGG